MINVVSNKKQLNRFVYFIKDLYKDCNNYVFPIFFSVKKELAKVVLIDKNYTAIYIENNNKITGRLLYTVSYSKQRKENIGYYSYFDCIDDIAVAKELFQYMEEDLKGKVGYIEGTFSPFDPDTRRGILVKGFNEDHTIFTSYNFDYYQKLLSFLGYEKAYDTYTVGISLDNNNCEKITSFGSKVEKMLDVSVDSLNFEDINKDIKDIHHILKSATNELNYQEAPSLDLITNFAASVKFLLNPELVKIARVIPSGEPVGFCVALPDFNQILAKTKGKINPFLFITGKRKINSARGILQYVVPSYQKKGLIILIYYKLYEAFKKYNITKFEGGTILEKNSDSWGALVKFGGSISKIYRIMGKTL